MGAGRGSRFAITREEGQLPLDTARSATHRIRLPALHARRHIAPRREENRSAETIHLLVADVEHQSERQVATSRVSSDNDVSGGDFEVLDEILVGGDGIVER